MHSWAKLRKNTRDRFGLSPDLAELIERAVESDLYRHYYADPHSDAWVEDVRLEDTIGGFCDIEVHVTVECYPSTEEIRQYYERGYEGIFHEPGSRTLTHRVIIRS